MSDPSAGAPPPYPHAPEVRWEHCPIAVTLGVLGRKWTLTVLRDIAFFPKASFALIRRGNRGLQPRTLSQRLAQLQREGLVRKVVPSVDPHHPYYELTERGLAVWPILAALFQFGISERPAAVFADARERNLEDVYPHDAPLLLGHLAAFARSAAARPGVRADGPTGPDPPAR